MTRITATFLVLALTLVVFGAEESHLRSELATSGIAGESGSPDEGDNDTRKYNMEGDFSVEKGMKCHGSWKKDKGAGKTCEGGMKSEFEIGVSAGDIAKEIARQLLEETNNFIPGDVEAYYPDEDAMMALMAFDDESMESMLAEGHSKTVEYGGLIKAEWGCKLSFGLEKGKFTKKSECGFKGMSRSTKKPEEAETF